MLLVRLYDAATNRLIGDYTPNSVSISETLNEVGGFDFEIHSSVLQGNPLNLRQIAFAEVWYQGELITNGIVSSVKIGTNSIYIISCDSQMAELVADRAKSLARYQDAQVIGIILDLLGYSDSSWRLGEILTMEDFFVRTTIDLRSEKRLFAQISKVISSIPNLFLRYGGDDGTHKYLDIGLFNEQVHPIVFAENVISFTNQVKFSEILQSIEVYGGEYTVAGVPTRVDLWDALDYDPTLATDPDFPILDIVGYGLKYIQNSNLSVGGSIQETFQEIVPATKADPSSDEIEEAGYALYLKGKSVLLKYATFEDEWNLELTEIPSNARVGDRIHITANAEQVYYDYLNGRTNRIPIGEISGWFRIISLSRKIEDVNQSYQLRVTPNLQLETLDPFLALYDAIPIKPTANNDDLPVQLFQYDVLSVTIPAGSAADCFNGEPGNYYEGKLYTIPLGTIPGGADSVSRYGMPFTRTENVQIRIVQEPALPATGIQVCVSVNNNWTTLDTLTLYALVEYVT